MITLRKMRDLIEVVREPIVCKMDLIDNLMTDSLKEMRRIVHLQTMRKDLSQMETLLKTMIRHQEMENSNQILISLTEDLQTLRNLSKIENLKNIKIQYLIHFKWNKSSA